MTKNVASQTILDHELAPLPGLGPATAIALSKFLQLETVTDLLKQYALDQKALYKVRGVGATRILKAMDYIVGESSHDTLNSLLASLGLPAVEVEIEKTTSKKAAKKAPKKAAKKASKTNAKKTTKAAPKKTAGKTTKDTRKNTKKTVKATEAAPKTTPAAPAVAKATKTTKKKERKSSKASTPAKTTGNAELLMLREQNETFIRELHAMKVELETMKSPTPQAPVGFRLFVDCTVSEGNTTTLQALMSPLMKSALSNDSDGTLKRLEENLSRWYADLATNLIQDNLIPTGSTVTVDSGQVHFQLAIEILSTFATEVVQGH